MAETYTTASSGGSAAATYGSKWGSLNRSLLASIYEVTPSGEPSGGARVVAPLTEANIELTANWQSAFENIGVEAKLPTLMAMLQNGTLESYSETLLPKGSDGLLSGILGPLRASITELSRGAQGRSTLTKLNSTQVFTGAAPVKVPVTMIFRAFDDPDAEVQAPVDQLARWTLARQLAANGSIAQAIRNYREGQGVLKSLLPSEAPQLVGLRYAGYTFAPLVIESMSHPLTVPRSKDGEPLHVAVQLQLASLTALDAGDWTRARQGKPTLMFNTSGS